MKLICEPIKKRRSCRFYDNTKDVPKEDVEKLIFAASLAPSGKNLQPWRFKIIKDGSFGQFLSELLPNNRWVKYNRQFICVFLASDTSYSTMKNSMAIGASIENMLLEAQANGISTCWIGECTEYSKEIKEYLNVENNTYVLSAVIVFGYSIKNISNTNRKEMKELII